MSTCHYGPDPSLFPSNHWVDDRENEYSQFEEIIRKFASLGSVSDYDRRNRGLAVPGVEAYVFQSLLEVAGVVPELLDQGRLFLDELKRRNARACNGRWMGPREKVASDFVLKIHAEVFRTDNISSDASESFREGSHVNVHLSLKVEVIGNSTAVLSQNTVSVCIVHIGHRIVLLSWIDDVFQGRYVSVHAEDAVSND